jgi:antirestriction protein ArdC
VISGRYHKCSMGNALVIMLQGRDATQMAGFRMWLTLDRHVRKGEKGLRILAPTIYKRTETNAKGAGVVHAGIRGLRPVCVFDVSQTDGADLLSGEELHDRLYPGDP